MIPDLAEATITLTNNTQLQIKLYDIAGRLIDTAGDGIGKPMPGDIAQKERGPSIKVSVEGLSEWELTCRWLISL